MAKRQMIKKIKWKYDNKGPNYEVRMHIDLARFEKQYHKAQWQLDNAVMTDMVPYMPHQTGTFINVTRAMSAALAGTGKVVAAAPPMGRFLYEGKVMIDPQTGSPWAHKGAKKVVTDKDLDFNKASNTQAQAHWFDAAKNAHGRYWIKMVKKTAGGG